MSNQSLFYVSLLVLLQVYSWKLSNREACPLHPHRLPCDYLCSNWKPEQALRCSSTWPERCLFRLVSDKHIHVFLVYHKYSVVKSQTHKTIRPHIKMLLIKATLCLQYHGFIFRSGAPRVGLYCVGGARGAGGLETQDSASLPWSQSWGPDVTKQRNR